LKGFDSANWHATIDDDSSSVTFSLLSPDGDQGYPGNLNAFARYSLSPVSGEVKVEYWGIPDKKTPINLSNHVYLNLAGHNKGWGLTIPLIVVEASQTDAFLQTNAKKSNKKVMKLHVYYF
jgi:aldose 1-epimerase